MALTLQTAPSTPCVTTAEAKLHLRIDAPDEDALIASLVLAATQEAEHIMGRAVMPQQWQLTLDGFFDPSVYAPPPPITIDLVRGPSYFNGSAALNLARPPVTSIVSVKYNRQSDGTLVTLAGTEYQLVAANDYNARLVPAYGKSWPAVQPQPECVQVIFACGYTSAAAVPDLIKAWVKLRIGMLYENKEVCPAAEFNVFLLDRYRTFTV
jgi:hypothetical protein